MQNYHWGKYQGSTLYKGKIIYRQLKPRFQPVFAYSGGILKLLAGEKIILIEGSRSYFENERVVGRLKMATSTGRTFGNVFISL